MFIFVFVLFFLQDALGSSNIIVTNHPTCTDIGARLMKRGSITDVAIGVMLCEGVLRPQDSGIGGGFYGIFKINQSVFLVNAREQTPEKIKFRSQINKRFCNIGIPGAIKGYKFLHDNYGKMSWQDILKPIIKICYEEYSDEVKKIAKSLNFNHILPYNKPLCQSLEKISIFGPDYFYKNISKKILKDLNGYNKYIHYKDFIEYKINISSPSVLKIDNYTIFSTKYPAVGETIIQSFKKIIEGENIFNVLDYTYGDISQNRYFKYFKKPQKRLILSNTHGTTNICIKKKADYLCITSTINLYFGSKFYSKSTGVILNNQLDDIPAYYTNIPSKMIPPTSISTTIIKKHNKLQLMLGGTGGSRIPAGIINVLYNFYILKEPLKKAIAKNRYFFFNNILEIEFKKRYLTNNYFADPESSLIISRSSYNTVTGLTPFEGSYDPRRGGAVYFEKIN